jgi:hypothetical protein
MISQNKKNKETKKLFMQYIIYFEIHAFQLFLALCVQFFVCAYVRSFQ